MLFSTQKLFFSYADNQILNDINLTFEDNDRIGLIGLNGTGKSTFLRLLTGELLPDSGSIYKKNHLNIGYLEQNANLMGSRSVYEEALDAFSDVFEAEKRMREIETELNEYSPETSEYKTLVDEHKRLDDHHSARDGYRVEYRIKYVLTSMGFAGAEDKSVSVLSGGERTRLALAKLLLSDLELLLLDEPTNHLDVSTMAWLESYLTEKYKGALLIVSHDRYFLDKTVNKIYELEDKKINVFKGNYTKYKQLKAEKIEADTKAYEKQRQQVEEMLEYAERNIARASTSKSAKSRLHRVANMDILEKPYVNDKKAVFEFEIINECNKNVLSVQDLTLKAGDKTLLEHLSFDVYNKNRLAIVGENGIGKSTLVKTLLGFINNETDRYNPVPNLQSSGGITKGAERQCNSAIFYGKNLRISYYDQESLNLDPNNAVLEELWFRFPLMEQTTARAILARMLFTAEDMDKKVSALSGGERAKLAFAVILAEKSNLLIFDEPTNHLDLASREALEEGLKKYQGTLIYVSHDRYFMNATCTSVLELGKDGGRVYNGTYNDYLKAKEKEKEQQKDIIKPQEEKPKETKPENKFFRTKEDRRAKAMKALRIKELESKISEIETNIQTLNDQLISGTDYKNMPAVYAEIERLQALLETTYEEWEKESSEE